MPSSPRPVSPHLSIYRKQITSVLSITHRFTGLALVAGMALVVVWLWSAAYQPAFYTQLHSLLSLPLGRVCLIGWAAAIYYHLANGIRHLFWDAGVGLTNPQVARSGWLVVLLTLAMTAVTWGYVNASTGM